MRIFLGASALALAAATTTVHAQEAPPATGDAAAPVATEVAQPGSAGLERKQVYSASDFSRFAPRTALDMLRQVPGFSIRESEDARGLGQATGNVLIDGQRISGKDEDATTRLSRINAGNVARIEIVDGATLGVPGLSGQVANIITLATGVTGRFEWRPEMRAHYTDPVLFRGEASVTGKTGPVEYTLGLSNNANFSGAGGPTDILNADGTLRQHRDEAWNTHYYQPKATAALTFDGPGSSIGHLNVAAYYMWYNYDELGLRSGPAIPDSVRTYLERQEGHNYEIGGDYEFALGPGRLKVIGLNRYDSTPYYEQGIVEFADGSTSLGDRYEQSGHTLEQIARAEYGWKMGGAEWQLSGEAAFNTLDIEAGLFALDPTGEFLPLPFDAGSGGVKEDRYEAMLSYGRPLAKGLTLQLNAGAEYSKLAQSGANAVVREFWRPKGQLLLAWAADKGLDISFKLQRKVGQLNFGDFLAKVFINEGNANAGNVDLVPPQSWEYDLETKKSLGKWGTTTLKLYGREIEDLVETIPIGVDGQSPGNIDKAWRRGIEWTSTFELAPLGIAGAKLDTYALWQKSRVRDPLTGENRPISNINDRVLEVSYRHDIPGTDWAYGGDWSYAHSTLSYRLTQVGRQFEGPNWVGVFIEHKDVFGLTVNARAGNLLNARSRWDRTVYSGFRDRSPVSFIERRDRLIGPIFTLTVKGAL